MDPAQALADLTEISSQIEAAVLFGPAGAIVGATRGAEESAAALVRGALELLEGAAAFRSDGGRVVQLEASMSDGSVFVVRDDDRGIVATTGSRPTVGLVFYDLKSCLRGTEAEPEPAKRRAAKAKSEESAPDESGGG
jgi:Roadblock/LC7 domain